MKNFQSVVWFLVFLSPTLSCVLVLSKWIKFTVCFDRRGRMLWSSQTKRDTVSVSKGSKHQIYRIGSVWIQVLHCWQEKQGGSIESDCSWGPNRSGTCSNLRLFWPARVSAVFYYLQVLKRLTSPGQAWKICRVNWSGIRWRRFIDSDCRYIS